VDLIRDVFGVEVVLSELPMAAGKRAVLPYARRRAPDAAAASDSELPRPVENPDRTPSPH
jgi:hypothetical protein